MPVAVIPARGGSKRIPRKNIKVFQERPALYWPIRAARRAAIFDRIVVSTDDPEIAEVAISAGAEIPFMRNPDLSDDMTGTTDVVRDAVKRLNLPAHDPVCCIYATALFVRTEDILKGARLLEANDWVLSLGLYPTPIDRAYRKDGTRFVPRDPGMMTKRSQDLEPAYFDAGQFYWALADTWRAPAARIFDGTAGVVLPADRAVDIDTEEDWSRAERMAALLGFPE